MRCLCSGPRLSDWFPCSSIPMASLHNPPPTLAIAIVLDSSTALALEWPRIFHDYFPQLFRRLAGDNPSVTLAVELPFLSGLRVFSNLPFSQNLRLAFVTYGPQDCEASPIFVKRSFAIGTLNELKDNMTKLEIGRTATGGSLGMATLEGYAAAIEVLVFCTLFICMQCLKER